jgi:hypothetical protein
MSEVEKIEKLAEGLRKYVNTSFELNKLELTEQASVIGAGILTKVVIALVIIFFLFFVSIAAGFYLSSLFDDNYTGFLIVAGFYLLLALFLVIFRKQSVERSFRDRITWKIFSQTHKES